MPTPIADEPRGFSFFGRARASAPVDAPGVSAGQVIGDFRLVRPLGQGGMGQVWEAVQLSLGRTVALKLVRPERITEKTLALFAREARAGGRLHHPHLVTVHGHGTDDDVAWIAMELVEGSWTLRDFLDDVIKSGEVPPGYYRDVAALVARVADGMQAAHAAGVIHRDLKPQNILIDPEDRPKITDFGLAKLTDESALSVTGDFAGTYWYTSPEQIAARRMGLDHRTDVFSLGVVLYELLAQRRPFDGDTMHQVAEQVLTLDPPDLRTVRSRIPRDLAVITAKCLAKARDRRYSTMSDLAADLRRHLANEPVHAKPPSRLVKLMLWARRNPTKSVAGGVAAVAFVVISALLAENVRKTQHLGVANSSLGVANTSLVLARDEATRKANDVLSLSAQKDLDDLVTEAESLWPAHPEAIPAYEDWLRRAQLVIDGESEDKTLGRKRRPSLEEHRATLCELRRRARPQSEEAQRAERESHPRFAELQTKRADLAWRARMLELEPWPDESHVEAELAGSDLPTDANALNALAWPLVNPESPVRGNEVRALLLARRAVAAAAVDGRSGIRDTLAWALFALGRFDEALAEERLALGEPGGASLQESLAALESAIASWRGDERDRRRAEQETLALEIAALAAQVDARRGFEYDEPEDAWWDRQLEKLVTDLAAFSDPQTGLAGDTLAEPFGWGVAKRYEFARTIRERSVDGLQARERWSEAIAAIVASPRYGGLVLSPQMGLLPIGMDSESELWEFAHLQTGEPAERGPDGRLVLTEATGVVLVLIPGGTFWMGAQSSDPNGHNYDPRARDDESPVHEVELSPYLLAKHEFTQAQWQRSAARNPTFWGRDRYESTWNRAGESWSGLHPVEQINWFDCFALTKALDLLLPTEAQWEYGCRAGTETPFWVGGASVELATAANLSDAYAKAIGGWDGPWEAWDDGNMCHARVGRYRANHFGLHDMHGNVWEWCRDNYEDYSQRRARDPEIEVDAYRARVYRGGGFGVTAASARSAYRGVRAASFYGGFLGFRVARGITR
jgi:serine/threonine protein kinase/formylglycine-generating enzyme required for sulfatase activity